MYTEKTTSLSRTEIADKVKNVLLDHISGDWYKSQRPLYKRLSSMFDESHEDHHRAKTFVSQLDKLNDAMIAGRSVFAVCEKQPRNLDSGKHYYSVYYVNEEGKTERFWPYEFAVLVGMDEQNKDRAMPKWVFSSRAIGMSRLLDATDGLFSFLKKLGGCYAQIDCI